MSTLLEVRTAVVRGLVTHVKIPMVSNDLAQVLFEYLIDETWQRLPDELRQSLSKAVAFVSPEQADSVLKLVRRVVGRHLPAIFGKVIPEPQVEQVAQSIATTLMQMSAENVTATSFTAPAAKPVAPAKAEPSAKPA